MNKSILFRLLRIRAIPLALILLVGLGATTVAMWQNGSAAIARAQVSEAPVPGDLAVEPVLLQEEGQPALSGWVSTRGDACATVLLLHGRGSNKGAMAGRARLLLDAGFSVVMFDLQGHGGSGGEVRGFGYAEGEDVNRVLMYIRAQFPDKPIGAVGTSLGAAALMFADFDQAVDAYVLEQLYSTLAATAALRAPFAVAREAQSAVLLAQMPLRLGYGASDVRPVDRIGLLKKPILMLAAGADQFVGVDQTEALKQNAGADAELVWFDGAKHIDLQRYDPDLYTRTVVPFLKTALCSGSPTH